jgi:hypothetical protein
MKHLTIKEMHQQLREKINRIRPLVDGNDRKAYFLSGIAEDLYAKSLYWKARLLTIRDCYERFIACEGKFYEHLNGGVA